MYVGQNAAINIAGGRESLATAMQMEQAGKSPDWIFTRLGWFKGQDNHWRTEIPDNDFKLTGKLKKDSGPIPLKDAVKHDELFMAVPQMQNTTIEVDSNMRPGEGGYQSGRIMIGDPRHVKSILHEMQHDEQLRTGKPTQSQGSSGGKDYRKNLGEREAFDTEKRTKSQDKKPDLMTFKSEGDQSQQGGAAMAGKGKKEPPIKIGVGPGIGIPFADNLYGGLGFGKWLNGDKGWFWGPSVGTPVADNLGVGVGTVHPLGKGGKKAARDEGGEKQFTPKSDFGDMFPNAKSVQKSALSKDDKALIKEKGARQAG